MNWIDANKEIPKVGEDVWVKGHFEIEGELIEVDNDYTAAIYNIYTDPPMWFYCVVDENEEIHFIEGTVTNWIKNE